MEIEEEIFRFIREERYSFVEKFHDRRMEECCSTVGFLERTKRLLLEEAEFQKWKLSFVEKLRKLSKASPGAAMFVLDSSNSNIQMHSSCSGDSQSRQFMYQGEGNLHCFKLI